MPRGSYRPGAGRPQGSKTRVKPAEVEPMAVRLGLTPLEYMLTVMRDETADPERRAQMAMAAAPFVHAKPHS